MSRNVGEPMSERRGLTGIVRGFYSSKARQIRRTARCSAADQQDLSDFLRSL